MDDSHSPHGECDWFEDTVPITELDPSLSRKLNFDTEIVDFDDMIENNEEVVLDSEDEEAYRILNENKSDVDCISGKRDVSFRHVECDLLLNYVACDEPGESSQRNALEFVDRFLSFSDVGVLAATQSASAVRKNLSPLTSMSGSRSLAKLLVDRKLGGKDGAFEWDGDNVGGSGSPSDFGECQHAGHVDSKVCSNSSNVCEERSLKLNQQVEVLLSSDSTSGKFRLQEMCTIGDVPEMSIQNRKVKKPEEQFPPFSVDHKLDDCSGEGNAPDLFDIGFDTQMAAEAIEALSHVPSPAYSNAADYAYQGHQNSVVDSSEGLKKNQVHSKKPCSQVGALSNFEGIRRVSKPRTRPPGRRGKVSVYGDSPNESSNIKSPKLLVQRKGEEDARNNITHCKYEASSSTLVGKFTVCEQKVLGNDWITADKLKRSMDGSYSTGKGMQSPEVGIRTYRRKKRTPLSDRPPEISKDGSDKLKIYMGKSDSLGERMISSEVDITTYRRRKRTPLSDKTPEILSVEGTCTNSCSEKSQKRSILPSQEKQTTGSILDLNTLLRSDAWECPKRKRKHRKMLPHASGISNHYGTFKKVDGQEHCKKLLKKNLTKPKSSILKELDGLGIPGLAPKYAWKDFRKRKHVASSVRVLFSQHLEDNIIKKQKKIIGRLGISITSCSADATHFIADEFLRTRNMLEAIAFGKPVVTHLWLESCGQAGYLIDEKNYILRDAKKEKDIGFSLPISLACANRRPLLEGRRILLTPNIKPDREMVSGLVEAARGQVVDREQLISGGIPDDLLILSCEEDHQLCLPFIDKGLGVYSAELLLNGIVIQKLEYASHKTGINCPPRDLAAARGEGTGQ